MNLNVKVSILCSLTNYLFSIVSDMSSVIIAAIQVRNWEIKITMYIYTSNNTRTTRITTTRIPKCGDYWHRTTRIPKCGDYWHRTTRIPKCGNYWHRTTRIPKCGDYWHRTTRIPKCGDYLHS